MSGVSEWAESQQQKEDYNDFLQQLIDGGDIDGAAAGITKSAIAKGIESLSNKQRFVFDRDIAGDFSQPECERCGGIIPWTEAYHHIHHEKWCSGCKHSWNKLKDE